MAAESLSPFVYWGQNSEFVFLKVDLRDSEDAQVALSEDGLGFKANGVGVRGRNNYAFEIEFYLPIDKEKSKFRITPRNIEFQCAKIGVSEIWPRLTISQQKPGWLKIDFDKFAMEGDSDEETPQNEEKLQEEDEALWKKMDKEFKEAKEEASLGLKSMWLFVYNMFQWVGYSYVFLNLCLQYAKRGEESQTEAVASVGGQLAVCQIAAILEFIHPLLGVVKTGLMAPFMQLFGRNLVLFAVIAPEKHLHTEPWVWWLFLIWSCVEVIRYPFYMLSSINRESSSITWFRYTAWIPLYPLGFLLESIVILEAIPLYELSGHWSVEMPNMYNIAFNFPMFLRIYLVIFLCGAYLLMKRMYAQRQKKFPSSAVKTKTS